MRIFDELTCGLAYLSGEPPRADVSRKIEPLRPDSAPSGALTIPPGIDWPECRGAKPNKRYPIIDLADIKTITDNLL